MNGATLGALVGFFSAMVVLGIPLMGFLYRVDKRARRAVRLLTGHEEVENDGVLPRLRDVEETTDSLEETVVQADGIEYEQTRDASST